jgi:hypothetical protein
MTTDEIAMTGMIVQTVMRIMTTCTAPDRAPAWTPIIVDFEGLNLDFLLEITKKLPGAVRRNLVLVIRVNS